MSDQFCMVILADKLWDNTEFISLKYSLEFFMKQLGNSGEYFTLTWLVLSLILKRNQILVKKEKHFIKEMLNYKVFFNSAFKQLF